MKWLPPPDVAMRWGSAMDHIGIDVHKMESQLCILGARGELIERCVRTTPERFAEALDDRPRARILLEASTESEWVSRCLWALAREVGDREPIDGFSAKKLRNYYML
jgi:hypothetical protein